MVRRSKILSGGSGAQVKLIARFGDDRVYKSVPLSDFAAYKQLSEQYLWQRAHQSIDEHFPQVYDCEFRDGRFGYYMRYIEPTEVSISPANIIESIIQSSFPVTKRPFSAYIDRLGSHLSYLKNCKDFNVLMNLKKIHLQIDGIQHIVDNISLYDFFKMLSSRSDTYDKMVSNCHGDLTLGNIIGGKCIDSNHHVGEWNSWLLDVSKLAQSVHYDYEHMFSDDVVSVSQIGFDGKMTITKLNHSSYQRPFELGYLFDAFGHPVDILLFELSHYLRMLKYKLKISKEDFIKAYCIMCLIWRDIKDVH